LQVLDAIYFWARTIPERPAIIRPEGAIPYLALMGGIERAAEYFARNVPDQSKAVVVSIPSPIKTLLACFGLMRANFSLIVVDPPVLPQLPHRASNTLVCERDGPSLCEGTNVIFDESWLTGNVPLAKHVPRLSPTKKAGEIFFLTPDTAAVTQMRQPPEYSILEGTSGFVDYEKTMLMLGVNNATGFARACQIICAGKSLCFAPPGPTMPWLIDTYAINAIIASPQQALALAELQENMTRLPLADLRHLRLSGTSLSAKDATRIKNHVCRNIIMDYSPQQTGPIATAPHDMIAHIPNAVGFVIPGVEVQIVDAENRLMQANAEGFVRARTPQFLKNNLIDDPQSWFYTRNTGWLTDEGILCIA
jgi:hypothetical protein